MKIKPQTIEKDAIILTHAERAELCDELAALTGSPMTPLSPSLAALRDLLTAYRPPVTEPGLDGLHTALRRYGL